MIVGIFPSQASEPGFHFSSSRKGVWGWSAVWGCISGARNMDNTNGFADCHRKLEKIQSAGEQGAHVVNDVVPKYAIS